VEQPEACLDSEIDFLILALFFGLQNFRNNNFLGNASFAGEARYFLFRQKVRAS
jgi:hypothetical protein